MHAQRKNSMIIEYSYIKSARHVDAGHHHYG